MIDTPQDERPRRDPAEPGTVIDMRPASPTGAGSDPTPDTPLPPVESALVGKDGKVPAMDRKPRPNDATGPDEDIAEGGDAASSGRDATGDLDSDHAPDGPRADEGPVPTGLPDAEQVHASRVPPTSAGRGATPDGDPVHSVVPREPVSKPRRGGFAPLFLGGVVAAGLGAGAAWWAIPRLPAAWQPPVAAPAVDVEGITQAATDAARSEVERQSATIESRAVEAARQAAEAASTSAAASLAAGNDQLLQQARDAGAEAAAKLIAEAPASAQPDGSLQTTLAAQAQQLSALDEAIQQLRAAPAVAAATPEDLQSLRDQVAAQATELQRLAQRPAIDAGAADRLNALAADAEAATARINAAVEQAEARLRDAEAKGADLAAAAEDAARRARAATAAAAIGAAIETGAPRTAALAQLQEAGVEPPAALAVEEVPTLDQLATEYPPAARAAVRAALAADAVEGKGSVIGNFLRAQTGARSVAPRDGSDADAVLSRAGAAVQRGDIDEALDELAALPDAARPAMETWIARALAHADAQAALSTLTAPSDAGAPAPAATSDPTAAAPAPDGTAAPAPAPAPAAPSN